LKQKIFEQVWQKELEHLIDSDC